MAPGKPHAGADIAVGVFGKLPALGDFVSRGLPTTFTDPWHQWLVRGLVAAEAELGARFNALYDAMPVWRCMLAAGASGPDRAVGVMVPSRDAVGRKFPLLVAAVGAALPPASVLLDSGTFAKLEEAVMRAPTDSTKLQDWCAAVAALEMPCGDQGLQRSWVWRRFEHNTPQKWRMNIVDLAAATGSVFWIEETGCTGAGDGLPKFGGLAEPMGNVLEQHIPKPTPLVSGYK